MRTYTRHDGTSTIFVGNDGMQLPPVGERDAHIASARTMASSGSHGQSTTTCWTSLSAGRFKKVSIKAGETVEAKIELNVGNWGLWDRKMQYVVEKGEFVMHVGASSKDLRGNATVQVV